MKKVEWIVCFVMISMPLQAEAEEVGGGDQTAVSAFLERDFQQAETLALQAWEAAQSTPGEIESGLAAANLGAVRTVQGRFDEALELQAKAEDIFKQQEARTLLGRLTVARGVTHFLESRQMGESAPEEALLDMAAAKELLGADDLRLTCVEAEMLGRSSQAAHVQSGYMKYWQLQAGFKQAGDTFWTLWCALRIARIEGASGGHGSAIQIYAKHMAALKASGDARLLAFTLRNAGHAHRKKVQYDVAETYLKEALSLAINSENGPLQVMVLNDLSKLFTVKGDRTRAIVYDQEADAALDVLGEGIRSGAFQDTVLLDLYHLIKLRYASLLPYEVDLFTGFLDQLVLEK